LNEELSEQHKEELKAQEDYQRGQCREISVKIGQSAALNCEQQKNALKSSQIEECLAKT